MVYRNFAIYLEISKSQFLRNFKGSVTRLYSNYSHTLKCSGYINYCIGGSVHYLENEKNWPFTWKKDFFKTCTPEICIIKY